MLTLLSSNKVAGGWHKRYSHASNSTNTTMTFAIFLPPQIETQKVPVLYWLSGLTCSDENFMQKAGAFKRASELGIAIVACDTSPRGEGVADDSEQSYDFGLGAGFYLNATEAPFSAHYQMERYVAQELPALIEANFAVNQQRAISGHSMGGHGALTLGLKNATRYTSISAFSPISSPINCPWGQKALRGYLGQDQNTWQAYDSCALMAQTKAENCPPILVSQGLADDFLTEQLKPELLVAAAKKNALPLSYQAHEGYDHSYFFISSFIDQHLDFHSQYLTG